MSQNKKSSKDTSIVLELVRFLVIGIYGTIIDLAVQGWLTSVVSKKAAEVSSNAVAFFIIASISLVGFLVATPATWSLSAIWGFKNVSEESEKKSRSLKGSLIFMGFAFIGLLLATFVHFFGFMICKEWSSLNIDILRDFNFEKMFGEGGNTKVLFAWGVVFVIKTCTNMVFNYLTRKFILFKAPKKEIEEEKSL